MQLGMVISRREELLDQSHVGVPSEFGGHRGAPNTHPQPLDGTSQTRPVTPRSSF